MSLVLYMDFFITTFILGNYKFQIGENPHFLKHEQVYLFIIGIQVLDIVLNFFKIQIVDVRTVRDPVELAKYYITGQFISDVIACLPWSVIKPQLIFLRYLKFRKFAVYQNYFDEVVVEMATSFLNNEQIKKVVNAFRLVIQITFVSHFFANIWVLIGLAERAQNQTGWVTNLVDAGIQQDDFFSLYITAIYWVITSFSSVGYGDVVGVTAREHVF